MGHGFHEERLRARRRGRFVLGGMKWLALAGLVAATTYFAYGAGYRMAEADTGNLGEQVADLSARAAALDEERERLRRDLATATSQADELRRRYESDVPTGAISELLRVARTRLAAGVKPERLASVLSVAENARRCEEKPTTRRFAVRTGPQRMTADSVAFADRQVTLTATGVSSVDAAGRTEGLFDPAKPVTVTFTRIGGAETTATGVLPLHHSVVVRDVEYRFVIAPGDARGFVNVTADGCAYP
jgi:outer membrane murein-binding lipoprotein Lpp